MYNKEEGLKDREEYLEGWYTREDLDELINEDCKGIVETLTDE